MPRKKKDPAAIASLESTEKPKRRKSAVKEIIESREPVAVAEILDQSPAVATILASRVANATIEPDAPQAEPQTTPRSHAAAILAERPAYRQAPEQYFRVASHEREGIRVFKDTVMKGGQKIGVAAIQFAENRQPKEGEKDNLRDWGFFYKIEEGMWKREGIPGDPLGDNVIDATRKAAELAREREGLER